MNRFSRYLVLTSLALGLFACKITTTESTSDSGSNNSQINADVKAFCAKRAEAKCTAQTLKECETFYQNFYSKTGVCQSKFLDYAKCGASFSWQCDAKGIPVNGACVTQYDAYNVCATANQPTDSGVPDDTGTNPVEDTGTNPVEDTGTEPVEDSGTDPDDAG